MSKDWRALKKVTRGWVFSKIEQKNCSLAALSLTFRSTVSLRSAEG
jgi:hypothetical protein